MKTNYEKISLPSPPAFEAEFYYQHSATFCRAHVYPPHVHDSLEIYVLEEGDVSFVAESNIYKLARGDAFVAKPNELHNCILNSDGKHVHFCFWFELPNGFLFPELVNREFGKNNLISLPPNEKERLLAVCKELYAEKSFRKRYVRALELLELLSGNTSPDSVQEGFPPVLQRILDDANENFTHISSLEYFTEKYFVSASTLQRLFKKYLNVSPGTYIEIKRLAYSRKLLRDGKSVYDACFSSGFSDYSNYIRLFKKRFGSTPRRYRSEDPCIDIFQTDNYTGHE